MAKERWLRIGRLALVFDRAHFTWREIVVTVPGKGWLRCYLWFVVAWMPSELLRAAEVEAPVS